MIREQIRDELNLLASAGVGSGRSISLPFVAANLQQLLTDRMLRRVAIRKMGLKEMRFDILRFNRSYWGDDAVFSFTDHGQGIRHGHVISRGLR